MDTYECLLQAARIRHVDELTRHHGANLAFSAVVDESGAPAFRLRHLPEFKREFGERRGVNEIRIRDSSLFVIYVAHHIKMLAIGRGPALNGSCTSDQGAGLDIGKKSFRSSFGNHPCRPTDGGLVGRRISPVVVMEKWFLLLGLGPERKGIVSKMIVEIDEAGQHKPISDIDERGVFKARRSRGISPRYGTDKPVVA